MEFLFFIPFSSVFVVIILAGVSISLISFFSRSRKDKNRHIVDESKLKNIFNNPNILNNANTNTNVVEEATEICKNCGASILLKNGKGTCPYCGTKVIITKNKH